MGTTVQQLPFYLTLPSDASMTLYPGNTAAVWTTKLQAPISLHGQWEVALVEMIYPNTTYNLPVEQIIEIRQWGNTEDMSKPIQHNIKIPAGIYEANDLIDYINSSVPNSITWTSKGTNTEQTCHAPLAPTKSTLRFHFTPSERKTHVTFYNHSCVITFPKSSSLLQNILGFADPTVRVNNSESYVDEYHEIAHRIDLGFQRQRPGFISSADQWGEVLLKEGHRFISQLPIAEVVSAKCINTGYGNQTLFVYSDIADYQVIGDTVAPILRTLPIKANTAFQMIVERFDSPHYVKVIRNHIESIQVTIASDLGADAKFEVGKSLVKLHLRKAGMT